MIASIVLNSIALCVFIVLYLIIQYQNKINKKYLNDYEDRLEKYRKELFKYNSILESYEIDNYIYEDSIIKFSKYLRRKRKNKNMIQTYRNNVKTARNITNISGVNANNQRDIVRQKLHEL